MNPLSHILRRAHRYGALGFGLFAMLFDSLALADDLKEKMAAALTGFAGQPIGVEAVRSSPAPGIAEVQIENGPMIYATEDGNYFFLNGDLHQTSATGAINLTEERRAVTRKEQLAAVAVEDMVVFSPEGEARDFIAVFTDVTCFYCQKLHREVDQLNAK
ncbi:MAG: disulfide isomerase DsbC N-terminal domain-containing protein, partial [Luminiphilus sp.]